MRAPADPPPPPMSPPAVSVVLPCLDEERALPGVLAALPPGWEAVVVDNGSSDRSAAVAAAAGATVVDEPRRGYGAAVHAGLVAARHPVVAVIDADGSLDPGALPALVARLADDGTDLVCGRRRPVGRGTWPWHARIGNGLLTWMIRRSTAVAVHDIAPVRVARRDDLLALGLTDRRCGYPLELLLAAARRGWRVVEVDVAYRRRAAGSRSKISGTVRGTLTVARDFAAVLRRHRASVLVGPAAPDVAR